MNEERARAQIAAAVRRAVASGAETGIRVAVIKNGEVIADIPPDGTMTARGVARMYSALLGDVEGVCLVSPGRPVTTRRSPSPAWMR